MKEDLGTYHADTEKYAELVQRVYDDHAPMTIPPEYAGFVEGNFLQFLVRLSRYKFASKMLRASDSVLEVGSGSGLGAQFLAQFASEVVGLEVKASEVSEACSMRRRSNVSFLHCDLFEYEPSEVHDVVVALDVIEHMTSDQGDRLLEAMVSHLREDGMVIVGTPSIYSYPYQSEISKASHVKCYDQEELREKMDSFFFRTLAFSMNDEVVHTGFQKLAWYYFVLGMVPKKRSNK